MPWRDSLEFLQTLPKKKGKKNALSYMIIEIPAPRIQDKELKKCNDTVANANCIEATVES